MSIKTIEGGMTVSNARFCVVVARWNSFVVDSLEAGAIDTLKRHGTPEEDITIVRLPGAFVPDEDKSAFMVDIQLPDGASLERTEAVTKEVNEIMKADPDVDHVMTVYGYSMLKGIATSNGAFSIAVLKPWDERPEPSQHQAAVLRRVQGQLLAIPSALVMAFSPPPMNMRTLGPLSP